MSVFGAIEAGGTKFVCGVGSGPDDLVTTRFATGAPEENIEQIAGFFRNAAGDRLTAVGIGCFGPLDLQTGYITSTPKLQWQNYPIRQTISEALNVPVELDTDVNAAALGECRWGATQGLSDSLYLTVGTGVGGGAIVNGTLVHGMLHPEMGHIRVPHDLALDPYPGFCVYHDDCLEGLACGPAIEERWKTAAEQLPPEHEAWALEAHYLALALCNWICTMSPKRIVLGGGVMKQQHLFPLIRKKVAQLLKGYIRTAELTSGLDEFIVPPELEMPGLAGALALAQLRCSRTRDKRA